MIERQQSVTREARAGVRLFGVPLSDVGASLPTVAANEAFFAASGVAVPFTLVAWQMPHSVVRCR